MARRERGKQQRGAKPQRRRAAPRQRTRRGGRRASPERRGLRYGSGVVGKYLFRIRARHIADHLAPLVSRRALSAAKLDLVLRAVALLPEHARAREPGFVLSKYTWEQLHDLARAADTLGTTEPGFDAPPEVVKLKRDWVGDQLAILDDMGLVRREFRPGKRSRLIVLRDDGSGEPLDDPVGRGGEVFITIHGDVVASGALARWKASELCAYLAAMVAERYDPTTQDDGLPPGRGQWFRPLDWFADPQKRFGGDARVRIPFSVPTLERGLRQFRKDGLVEVRRIHHHPYTHARLQGPRNHYFNHFYLLGEATDVLDVGQYKAEVAHDDDADADPG